MRKSVVLTVVVVVLAVAGISAWQYLKPNPNALWQIVSERCVPEARSGTANNQCAKVDLNQGYVVFKDRRGIGQYLLIPTRPIEGIESPDLIVTGAHNYWRDAWDSRDYLERAIHSRLKRDDIGLAINSTRGRSQNQLHIHIDCMRQDVAAILRTQRAAIGEHWAALPVPLSGHHYQAMLITDETLQATNPFQVLYNAVRERGESMADQTLLLTGTTLADGRDGFVLLNDHVGPGDRASAEELLDHSCSVRSSGQEFK